MATGCVLAAGLCLAVLTVGPSTAAADDSHGSQARDFQWLLEIRADDGRLQFRLRVAPEQSQQFGDDSQTRQRVNESTRTAARTILADVELTLDQSVVALADHMLPIQGTEADEKADDGIEAGRFARFVPVSEWALESDHRPERLQLRCPQSPEEESTVAFVVYHRNVLLNSPARLTPVVSVQLDWLDAWQSRLLIPDASRPVDLRQQLFLTRDGNVIRCELLKHARLLLDDSNPVDGPAPLVSTKRQRALLRQLERDCPDIVRLEVDGERLVHSPGQADIVDAVPDGLIRREPDRERRLDGLLLGCRWVVPLPADRQTIQINCQPAERPSFEGRIQLRDADESQTIEPGSGGSMFAWRLQPGPPARMSEFVPTPLRERTLSVPMAGVTALLGTLFHVIRWWRARVWSLAWLTSTIGLSALTVVVWPHATQQIQLGREIGTLDRRARFADVCRPLLTNVYLASEDSSDSSRFDRLAEFVSPELRDRVFLALERSRRTRDPFEQLHVDQVTLIDVEQPQADGQHLFRAHCRWQVSGWVVHWGHRHQIDRQADAEVWIGVHDQQWKLARIEMSTAAQPTPIR